MYVFGEIDKSSTLIESNIVNYTQNLTTASAGIQSIKIVSGSINQSHWNSLNALFYTSGSPVYGSETKIELDNFAYKDRKQHLNKYHGFLSSSLISIPQKYYGERIKSGSFKFTDLNNTDKTGTINPIIKDDGFGNLYATNANHSQSAGALSSSQNYVGNIFYEKGLVVLTVIFSLIPSKENGTGNVSTSVIFFSP